METLSAFLKSKVPERVPKHYLRLTQKCAERVQRMTTLPTASPKFNSGQCKYLADKLDLVVERAQSFIGLLNEGSPEETTNCLEIFKLLYALANAVENFIQICCKDAWTQAAVFMTNVTEDILSLGFNLELCRLFFLVAKELTLTEVDDVFKEEVKIVEERASVDKETLSEKVIAFLMSKKSTGTEHKLAAFILKRLGRDLPKSIQMPALFDTLGSGSKQSKQQHLGKGAFGTVHRAKWLGVDIAKKTLSDNSNVPEFDNEVKILERLSHSNITTLLCYGKDKQGCSIVMELMDGDLWNLLLRRMKDKTHDFPLGIVEAIDIMLQIGRGVNYLHKMKIVHRDLKAKNILVRSIKAKELDIEYVLVKVADFGLSKTKERTMTDSNQTPNVGTRRWMAPELFSNSLNIQSQAKMLVNNDTKAIHYPFKTDVYSFGIVCYEILSGNVPFSEIPQSKLLEKILDGVRPQLPNHCPLMLKDLIERCWSRDQSKRPCFHEICLQLQHLKWLLLMPSNIMVSIPRKQPTDLVALQPKHPSTSSGNRSIPTKEKAWVVGIDFGTTYSGFAYASRSSDASPQIYVRYDWPSKTNNEKPYCKTLTSLYYQQTRPDSPEQLECTSWGHLARSDHMDRRIRHHGAQGHYLSRFKLLLTKELDNSALATSIPPPLTLDGVITDYLQRIGEHALADIRKQHVGDSVFNKDSVQWCVTVPSIWDLNAKQRMKACMVNAGLVSAESMDKAGGMDAVIVVLEPEAASFHCHQILLAERKDVSLNEKDKILVADVGGGTVDIVVQELIASGHDYKVNELTESSGGLCGGTFVDKSFMEFLMNKIGCLEEFLRSDYPSYRTRLLKECEDIKCIFGQDTDPKDINLHPNLALKWEAYQMECGSVLEDYSVVQLTDQDLKSIFDPVVNEILELIAVQLRQVQNIKVMFVVGGFANSPYLMQRIRSRFSLDIAHIVSPPNPGSAILQGAVSLALHPNVILSRVAKKTYGTTMILPFNHGLDPTELLIVTNGEEFCRSRFDVFVRKGTRVEVNTCVTKRYVPHGNDQKVILFDLYSSTKQDPRYTEGATVTKEGDFSISLPQNYGSSALPIFHFSMYFGRSTIELSVWAQYGGIEGQQERRWVVPVRWCS